MPSFLTPLLRAPGVRHVLENSRHGGLVAPHLLTAFDSADRKKGLLGRDSLPDGTAMIIAPCSAVHTFFMRFVIDIAFVAKDGRVIKVRAAVPPRRLAAAFGAFAVLELPAGALHRADVVAGDMLLVRALSVEQS